MDASENPASIHKEEAEDPVDQYFSNRGCCFWGYLRSDASPSSRRSGSSGNWWQRIKTAAVEAESEDKWWIRGWNRVREWSEIVAGPKWKTFIRRFNRNARGKPPKFRYDPLSYALNFDEGPNGQENEYAYGDFSTRFAQPAGRSRDFDKEGPDFATSNY